MTHQQVTCLSFCAGWGATQGCVGGRGEPPPQGCLGGRVGCILRGSRVTLTAGPAGLGEMTTEWTVGTGLSWCPLVSGAVSDVGWVTGHCGQQKPYWPVPQQRLGQKRR